MKVDSIFSELFKEEHSNQGKSTENIFDLIDERIKELAQKGIDILDFGVGDPAKTMGVPDLVVASTQRSIPKRKYFGYPGNRGEKEFRVAVSNYLQRELDVKFDPETEINITNASKTAVCIFPRLFVDVGDLVLCPAPGYPGFHQGTILANGIPYFIPLKAENDFLVDFENIPSKIAKKTKILWINYPNSPTGKSAPKKWLEGLVEWCQRNSIILASDEAYLDIYFDGKKPISPLSISKEGVISFYSLSKRSNMTGYRIGFAAGDKRIIEKFYKLKNMHDDGVPHFIQDAAIDTLNDPSWVANLRKNYQEKRDSITVAMMNLGCPKPIWSEGSIFLWIKAPKGMSGEEFTLKLLDNRIAVIPGSAFTAHAGLDEDPARDFVRFALMPALSDIKKVMAAL